jgi:hypothetical protein
MYMSMSLSRRVGAEFICLVDERAVARVSRRIDEDKAELDRLLWSGSIDYPPHARSLRTSPENASNLRLAGGERRIRTPETLSHSMEGSNCQMLWIGRS